MTGVVPKSLPVQPLLDWCAVHPIMENVDSQYDNSRRGPHHFSHHGKAERWEPLSPFRTLAIIAGVTDRTTVRWKEKGRLPMATAEDICDALGIHPAEMWGAAYYEEDPCSLYA